MVKMRINLKEAKEQHKAYFLASKVAQKALREGRKPDHKIKVYFITPDEDRTLTLKSPAKKGRAIVEMDTDGCYVLSENDIEESDKVKMFDKFIPDLKKLLKK
ncbi:MAG: BsaWI family type II restriction enzyme [Flammeovirgaceae bacterium]|nr:BsaWI family type II restriction enzyme [Flammeovirgaceae bacterium]MDW8287835.1 BsaWI family type II restriction enzyme [Flammeovirgaceae bacterium]